jgi:hypothetical protein
MAWLAFVQTRTASNLYDLGISPKVIQAILRRADIGTTLEYYVQTPAADSRSALARIEELLDIEPDKLPYVVESPGGP